MRYVKQRWCENKRLVKIRNSSNFLNKSNSSIIEELKNQKGDSYGKQAFRIHEPPDWR